jgi:AraC family transcriptional regulator, regulatory protein of adaptative response / methylated-DNA-[protein]-cysteine methyltransferase
MFRDGPLTRRAPETIRYGTGRSVLGALLVASSERGIVSIMLRDTQSRLIRDLGARFPKAKLVRDEERSKATVANVARYIAAPFRPFGLPLDIRGTKLQRRVWSEVRKIPFGETSTYSRIAEAIGRPRAIRAVANACSRSWFAFAVPCHRVLHKGGARGRTAATAASTAGSTTRRSSPRSGKGRWWRGEIDFRPSCTAHDDIGRRQLVQYPSASPVFGGV